MDPVALQPLPALPPHPGHWEYFWHQLPYAMPGFTTFVIGLALAAGTFTAAVLRKDRRGTLIPATGLFFGYAFMGLVLGLRAVIVETGELLYWHYVLYGFAVLVAPSGFFLAHALYDFRYAVLRVLGYIMLGSCVLAWVSLATGTAFSNNWLMYPFGNYPVAGWNITLWGISGTIGFLIQLGVLVVHVRREHAAGRKLNWHLIGGLNLLWALTVTNLPSIVGYPVYPLAHFSFLPMILISYGIFRGDFLDLNDFLFRRQGFFFILNGLVGILLIGGGVLIVLGLTPESYPQGVWPWSLIPLLSFAAVMFLGIFVAGSNPRERINQLAAVSLFVSGAFVATGTANALGLDRIVDLRFGQICYLFFSIVVSVQFRFIFRAMGREPPAFRFVCDAAAVLVALFALTPWHFTGSYQYSFGVVNASGFPVVVLSVVGLVSIVYGLYHWLKDRRERNQPLGDRVALAVIVGALLMICSLPAGLGYPVYPFGNLQFIPAAFIAHAVIRHGALPLHEKAVAVTQRMSLVLLLVVPLLAVVLLAAYPASYGTARILFHAVLIGVPITLAGYIGTSVLTSPIAERLDESYAAVAEERRRTESARAELEALNELGRAVNASTDIETIFEHIRIYLNHHFGLDTVWLLLIDPAARELYTYRFFWPEAIPESVRYAKEFRLPLRPESGTMYYTALSRVPYYVSDLSKTRRGYAVNEYNGRTYRSTRRDLEIVVKGRLHSVLQLPLVFEGRTIGILNLGRAGRPISLDSQNLESLVRFAEPVTTAVRNALLLDEVRREKEKAEEARLEIETLAEIAKQINAATGLDDILSQVMTYASDRFQLEFGWLVLVDEDAGEFFGSVTASIDTQWAETVREASDNFRAPLNAASGTLYRTYVRQTPLILTRLRMDMVRNETDMRLIRTIGLTNFAHIPLIIRGRVIGILALANRVKPLRLRSRDVVALSRFCDQIAGAVHNARLLIETEAARQSADTARADAEAARQRAEEADRQKTAFFQNISHELRTPLTLIVGPIESARKRGLSLDTVTMDMVMANGRRLQRLVSQLLDLQKLAAGKMEPSREALDLRNFLSRTINAFAPYAEGRGIRMEGRLPDTLPLTLVDVDHLDKCIYNYLSNAIKFTGPGGSITLSAELSNGSAGKMIKISVADTGTGIPPERQASLFQRFGPSEVSLTREQEGTGLGLALVKELIGLYGGTVGVDSAPGRGSTFWLTLPPAPEGTEAPPEPAVESDTQIAVEMGSVRALAESHPVVAAPFIEKGKRRGRRVLLVDDNADLRTYMEGIFVSDGYDVETASDGEEGVARVLASGPDLIVTDLMMPRVSGIEMIQRIRRIERFRTTPIILLTARADEETRQEVRRAGADDYLAKPFNESELLSAARNLTALKSKEAAFLREIARARLVQYSLLPDLLPTPEGMNLAAVYEPMEQIGGDFYDTIQLPDGRFGVLIADVSGHGMTAAMIASMVKAVFVLLSPEFTSPADLLLRMNEMLCGKLADNFITCCYAVVDPANRRIVFAKAGHPPPLLVRRGKADLIENAGRVLGSFKDSTYKNLEIPLEPGDRFFLFTDGLIECRNPEGEIYGEARLLAAAETLVVQPVGFQLQEFMARLREYQSAPDPQDDVTLVGLAVL